MAHTHLEHMAMVNPKPGIFPLYCKVDFSKHPLAAAADYLVLAKILDKWIVLDSFWKLPTASTSVATMDIGTTYDGSGQEVVAGADISGANTGWTQGAVLSGAIDIHAKDTYLTCEALSAAVSDGILEVLLIVASGVDESEPADKAAVTS